MFIGSMIFFDVQIVKNFIGFVFFCQGRQLQGGCVGMFFVIDVFGFGSIQFFGYEIIECVEV